MDIKKIEMVIETSNVCREMETCSDCKYELKECHRSLNDFDFSEIIEQLYNKIKVNTDWGI